MHLGRITVTTENFFGSKNIYCRPFADGNGIRFPAVIGICHVVLVEKSILTDNLTRNQTFSCFAIFNRRVTREQFDRGYIDLEITPITEIAYNELILIYPDQDHAFMV